MPSAFHTKAALCLALDVLKLLLLATLSLTVISEQLETLLVSPTASRKASYHCYRVTI